MASPLTRYYAEKGTLPGRWLGSGLATVGSGALGTGHEVTEEQLRGLLGQSWGLPHDQGTVRVSGRGGDRGVEGRLQVLSGALGLLLELLRREVAVAV